MSEKPQDIKAIPSGNSLWKEGMGRFMHNKLAIFGSVFLFILVLLCVLAPLIAPYSYETQNLSYGSEPPGSSHIMGTDPLGRDLFTRILYGGRVSFSVGLCATAVSVLIGVIWGSFAGWFGGKIDSIMMRMVDIAYAFPFITIP